MKRRVELFSMWRDGFFSSKRKYIKKGFIWVNKNLQYSFFK